MRIKSLIIAIPLCLALLLSPMTATASAADLLENYKILKWHYPDQLQPFLDAGITEAKLQAFMTDQQTWLAGKTVTVENFDNKFINSVLYLYLEKPDQYQDIFDVLKARYGSQLNILLQGQVPESLQGMRDALKNTWFETGETGKVSITDLAMLGLEYGRQSGNIGFYTVHDLNHDGVIDLYDLVHVSRNYGGDILNMMAAAK